MVSATTELRTTNMTHQEEMNYFFPKKTENNVQIANAVII